MGLDYNEANLSNSNLILLLLHSNANCDMFIQNTRQAVWGIYSNLNLTL